MKVATVDEMRFMDRYAIEKLGIAEETLMENAGHAAINVLQNKTGIRAGSLSSFVARAITAVMVW
jgi:ADP-dependent NAD(P)H-hydrate dehydratase / NAD(P)H-hydrate epimerase